jgi:hypothetical protein
MVNGQGGGCVFWDVVIEDAGGAENRVSQTLFLRLGVDPQRTDFTNMT